MTNSHTDLERTPYIMYLRLAVEKKAGFPIKTSRDFENLSFEISESKAGYISTSTLKRIWGYVRDSGRKNLSTLDVLARYATDADNFETFCRKCDANLESESGFNRQRTLDVSSLKPGDIVQLAWQPGRIVQLLYQGKFTFSVTMSEKSRLKTGMKVKCFNICAQRPLLLTVIDSDGLAIAAYECGKINGVEWSLLI